MDNQGKYHDCEKHDTTLNKYLVLDTDFTIIKEHTFKEDYVERRYIGIENLRIFHTCTGDEGDPCIQYMGTRYNENNENRIVYGTYDVDSEKITDVNEIQPDFIRNEKNWVFAEYKNETHIIYKWYPFQICKLDKESGLIRLVKEIEMPHYFSHVQSSTCGYKYEEETWFVLHIVSYESSGHYYHCLAVFDENMMLKKYSAPFKFKGEPIEYCIGLIVEQDRVIMTYSCWDRTTELAIYEKSYIDELLKVWD